MLTFPFFAHCPSPIATLCLHSVILTYYCTDVVAAFMAGHNKQAEGKALRKIKPTVKHSFPCGRSLRSLPAAAEKHLLGLDTGTDAERSACLARDGAFQELHPLREASP